MTSFGTTADRSFPGLGTTTYELDPLRDSRWTAFTDQCSAASLGHRREWLHALQVTYGCEPLAVTTCSPGSALANALVLYRVRSFLTGRRLVSIPFTDHCEPLANQTEEVDRLVASLCQNVVEEGWKYFEIRPVEYAPPSRLGLAVFNTYLLHRLDLEKSEDALLRSFHKSCIQRKILKAERQSLRCTEGRSETLLRHFYQLLVMTRRRLGLPPQPIKWFRNLIASLGEDLKIRVAYNADIPVASILTIRTKETMVYKYGCSDTRFNHLGGTVLLLWNAICEARANGMLTFDMGRSDLNQAGLIAFKEHWGARRTTLNYWCYPAPKIVHHRRGTAELFRKFAKHAPSTSLVLLGNLLYKHIA